jgi:hypothetical protein
MGCIDYCGGRTGGARLALHGVAGHHARPGLLYPDRRDHAAERDGCGFGGGVRGSRQPDGIWTARRHDIFVACDHVVRNLFYDDVDGAIGEARRPECGGNRLDSGGNVGAGSAEDDAGSGETGRAGSGEKRSGSAWEAGEYAASAQVGASVTICPSLIYESMGIYGPGGSGGTGRRTSLRGENRYSCNCFAINLSR